MNPDKIQSIDSEQDQISYNNSSVIIKKKIKRRNMVKRNYKVNEKKDNNEISEKIIKLQQQQYQFALDEVKTDIRELCLELHEYIESISNNLIYNQHQGVQEIILEFYKDIFFEKHIMDNLKEFSEDQIISVWNKKYKEQVFGYVRYINFNDIIIE